ncbi:OmpA family protein [Campylobacter mucosalis]|uniref:Peptidoglycan-associated lipoprotein n=1 Tax=Campylobacter mucosalis CCUG 21559 TaxID=1032067 RepID=A0A6G5QFI4_9BACT|nr:OmpA family protein [Campylobacter mucosalis]QCD44266.1 Tol-Pal system peptidoglycan-associated lipoprotein [Campylobacter mucosalis CCUG 21559]
MKKIVLASVAVAALVFSGCSSKAPEVDTNANMNSSSNSMSDTDRLNALIASIQGQVKNVYFDFDKFNVKADQQGVVSSNASLFNQADAQALSVKVEGNCDEWGTDEYNYALGLKRAKSVKDALVSNGVSADRIAVVSFGESNPVCSDKSKACDAQNRRVEFKVLP